MITAIKKFANKYKFFSFFILLSILISVFNLPYLFWQENFEQEIPIYVFWEQCVDMILYPAMFILFFLDDVFTFDSGIIYFIIPNILAAFIWSLAILIIIFLIDKLRKYIKP